MATTAPSANRYLSLDLIRGIAVMGILLMNIVALGLPSATYLNPLAYGGDRPVDIAAWATMFVVADGKMRGLFSVLFGASMLLVIERAEAKGENPALVHYSRLSWLLLFGVIHAYAIWYGDILMLYAVIGAVAFFFRKMEAHKLVTLGLILIFAQIVLFGLAVFGLWMSRELALAPDAPAEALDAWRDAEAQLGGTDREAIVRQIAIHQGSYADILSERLGSKFWEPIKNNLTFSIETLGLMLLGMAGLKSGFLTGGWEKAAYARLARIGYLIGLPLLVILAIAVMRSGFDPVISFALKFPVQMLVNPLVILAHASIIIYWLKSAGESALVRRIAATGRAAFTNYLGTSIVCTFIFYGYGFGLYGEMGRADLYLVMFGVWALMLLWSKPWLDRFRYGPLEWLWRTLARREVQPVRKPLP